MLEYAWTVPVLILDDVGEDAPAARLNSLSVAVTVLVLYQFRLYPGKGKVTIITGVFAIVVGTVCPASGVFSNVPINCRLLVVLGSNDPEPGETERNLNIPFVVGSLIPFVEVKVP